MPMGERPLLKMVLVLLVSFVFLGFGYYVRYGNPLARFLAPAGPVEAVFEPLPPIDAERAKFTLQQKMPTLFTPEQTAAMRDVSMTGLPLEIVGDDGQKTKEYLVKMEHPAFCDQGRCPFFIAKRVDGPEKVNDVGIYAMASKVVVGERKMQGHPDLFYVDNVVGQAPVRFRWQMNPDDDGYSYAPNFFDE